MKGTILPKTFETVFGHRFRSYEGASRWGRLLRLWPYVLLFALTLAWHTQVLFAPTDRIIDAADYLENMRWVHEFIRQSFRDGRLPLWNPYIMGGVPFVANPATAVFYPPTWLCVVMPVSMAERCLFSLHTFMTGIFMFGLLRDRRLSIAAALIGASVWMFGSYQWARGMSGHVPQFSSGAWIPLAVMLWWRALERASWRWATLTGVVIGVQALAGDLQTVHFTMIALMLIGMIQAFHTQGCAPARGRWRSISWVVAGLALVGVVGVGVAAVQVIPGVELARLSDRPAASFDFITQQSVPPTGFLGTLMPWNSQTNSIHLTDAGIRIAMNWESSCYVGLAALALASAATAVRRNAAHASLLGLALLAVILMLGRFTPIYRVLLAVMPSLGLFRIPARAGVLLAFALAALAGFGVERLRQPTSDGRRPWMTVVPGMAVGVIAVSLLLWLGGRSDLMRQAGASSDGRPSPPLAISLGDTFIITPLILAASVAIVWLALRWLPVKYVAPMVIALVAIDLWLARPGVSLVSDTDGPLAHSQRFAHLASRLGEPPFRVDMPYTFAINNAGVASGVENINGYWPLPIARPYRLLHSLRGAEPLPDRRHTIIDNHYQRPAPAVWRLFNVRAQGVLDFQRGRGDLVFADRAYPRTWLVRQVAAALNEEQALQMVSAETFDPATTIVLEHASSIIPSPGADTLDYVRVAQPREGGLDIDVHATSDAYLVLSEVYYPGWVARVNGRSMRIERANYAMSSVPLKAGDHKITYRFEPDSFRLGASLSLATIVGVVLVLTVPVVRSHRTRCDLHSSALG